MAYDGERSYLSAPITIAAQNAVSTASGAIVAGATLSALLAAAEATQIVSIVGVVTATPTTPPGGVKPFVVVGTTTTTGATAIPQSSASSALNTFTVPIALAAAGVFQIGLVCTGTANATETIGATNLWVGLAPQFV